MASVRLTTEILHASAGVKADGPVATHSRTTSLSLKQLEATSCPVKQVNIFKKHRVSARANPRKCSPAQHTSRNAPLSNKGRRCTSARASGDSASSARSEGVAVVAAAEERSVDDLKRSLIRAVGGTNRGKNATAQQRQQILELIEELESRNATSDPIKSPLVSGRWALLYTAPTNEKVDKYAGTEEGPFLARVKPLALGGVRQKGSIQVIDAENGRVDNIAEFIAFNVPGSLNIKGSCKEAEPIPTRGAVRLDVTFESFVLSVGKNFVFTIPLGWVNPKGWVDTTFLDEDTRIGRGDKGSVFVTSRIKQS